MFTSTEIFLKTPHRHYPILTTKYKNNKIKKKNLQLTLPVRVLKQESQYIDCISKQTRNRCFRDNLMVLVPCPFSLSLKTICAWCVWPPARCFLGPQCLLFRRGRYRSWSGAWRLAAAGARRISSLIYDWLTETPHCQQTLPCLLVWQHTHIWQKPDGPSPPAPS